MKKPALPKRRAFLRMLAALFAAPFLPARAAATSPAHHLSDGTFRNTYAAAINKPFRDLLRWRREAPEVALQSFPLATKQTAFLADNKTRPTITWIGHATALLQAGGFNIITDPHFSDRASPLPFAGPKRGTPPGLSVAELPPLDAVLISHNHYDHLDGDSLRLIAAAHPRAQFFTPLRLKKTVAEFVEDGDRVTELDWGEEATLGGLRLIAEPCQHWSRRGFGDRNKTLWASWVVMAGGFKFLFVGDTGYSRDFADLGEKYNGFDAAALPIGAYAPRWFMKDAHIEPAESVRIMQEARARFALATHWGTFILTDEPMDEPPKKLRQAMAEAGLDSSTFAVFQHGETRDLSFLRGQ